MVNQAFPHEAIEFAGFVLVHCAVIADANREGELICPFAVIADSDGRQLIHFESDTQAEAVSRGWASLLDAQSQQIWWAFGREGIFRNPDGTGTDVITVSVWIPGMNNHYSLSQRFGRRSDQELFFIGEPEIFRHEAEAAEPVEHWDKQALQRGVFSHPKSEYWPAWCGLPES